MPKWTDKPWERQKGESDKAYEAFVTYRDMGTDRSIRAVAQEFNRPLERTLGMGGAYKTLRQRPRKTGEGQRCKGQESDGRPTDKDRYESPEKSS